MRYERNESVKKVLGPFRAVENSLLLSQGWMGKGYSLFLSLLLYYRYSSTPGYIIFDSNYVDIFSRITVYEKKHCLYPVVKFGFGTNIFSPSILVCCNTVTPIHREGILVSKVLTLLPFSLSRSDQGPYPD